MEPFAEHTEAPKYIVARSNFSTAYVYGVPLRIIGTPYEKTEWWFSKTRTRFYIRVVSLITGITYEIPYDRNWITVFNSYEELIADCAKWIAKGYKIYSQIGDVKQVVNKLYYPRDNSHSSDFEGKHLRIAGKVCRILSIPFLVKGDLGGMKWCVLVQDKEVTGRAFFTEDVLI